jgi:hypothetical protein
MNAPDQFAFIAQNLLESNLSGSFRQDLIYGLGFLNYIQKGLCFSSISATTATPGIIDMEHKALQMKLDKIKSVISELYPDEDAISAANLELMKLQLTEYEELIGPEMDEAEMFYVESRLDELALRLDI